MNEYFVELRGRHPNFSKSRRRARNPNSDVFVVGLKGLDARATIQEYSIAKNSWKNVKTLENVLSCHTHDIKQHMRIIITGIFYLEV